MLRRLGPFKSVLRHWQNAKLWLLVARLMSRGALSEILLRREGGRLRTRVKPERLLGRRFAGQQPVIAPTINSFMIGLRPSQGNSMQRYLKALVIAFRGSLRAGKIRSSSMM